MIGFRRLLSRAFADLRGSNERGAIAVEFALVLPVLLVLVFGVVQFGNILSTRQIMIYAAREAARSFAVGESTVAQAQQVALNRLATSQLNFTINVTQTAVGASSTSEFVRKGRCC